MDKDYLTLKPASASEWGEDAYDVLCEASPGRMAGHLSGTDRATRYPTEVIPAAGRP